MPVTYTTRNRRSLTFAKSLRKRLTSAEVLLWRKLRNRNIAGLKFRRQCPVGKYIADFACIEKMLIIELDGSGHGERKDYDTARDAELTRQGFRVLRFGNRSVKESMDWVLIRIHEEALNCCILQ